MSTIDRYKKKGGFVQLLAVLEGSSPQKQEQFFNLIGAESKSWEAALRKKILSIEKILAWSPEHLTDLFSSIPHLTSAMTLHSLPQDKIDFYLKYLNPKDKRKIADLIAEKAPSAGEKSACAHRVIQEVRSMISKGQLKLEKIDPELVIEENIEFQVEHNLPKLDGSSSGQKNEETAPAHFGESEPTEAGTTLRFELPSKNEPPANMQDLESMRRKLSQMAKELDTAKQENQSLRARLDQIRKIA